MSECLTKPSYGPYEFRALPNLQGTLQSVGGRQVPVSIRRVVQSARTTHILLLLLLVLLRNSDLTRMIDLAAHPPAGSSKNSSSSQQQQRHQQHQEQQRQLPSRTHRTAPEPSDASRISHRASRMLCILAGWLEGPPDLPQGRRRGLQQHTSTPRRREPIPSSPPRRAHQWPHEPNLTHPIPSIHRSWAAAGAILAPARAGTAARRRQHPKD